MVDLVERDDDGCDGPEQLLVEDRRRGGTPANTVGSKRNPSSADREPPTTIVAPYRTASLTARSSRSTAAGETLTVFGRAA
jgi:hypothetical protein